MIWALKAFFCSNIKSVLQSDSQLQAVKARDAIHGFVRIPMAIKLRLTVVSREAKEEVPCDGLSTNAREYFTRTNLVKIKNAITYEPLTLALHYSR